MINTSFSNKWCGLDVDSIDNATLNLLFSNLEAIGELATTSEKLSFMDNGEITKSSNSLYRSFRGYLPSFSNHQYSDNISNLTSFRMFLDKFVENPKNNTINPRMIEILNKAKEGLESLLDVYIHEQKELNIEVTDSMLSNIEYYKTSLFKPNTELTTNQKIQSLFDKILSGENDEELKFYESQPSHRVFSLQSVEGKIFKLSTSNNQETKDRYKTMLNARLTCKIDNLFCLVVPEARKFQVEHNGRIYTVIEEEKLDIYPPDVQEELYLNANEEFAETVKQETTFICKSKFSDVEQRNLPIIKGTNNVGLIDLEENAGAKIGVLGGIVSGGKRRGLINCVNEKHIPIVLDEFKKYFPDADSEGVVNARKKELQAEADLNEYYIDNMINAGDQKIDFYLDILDFDSYSKEAQTILFKLAENLVQEINGQISSSTLTTKKNRRQVYVDLSPKSHFYDFKNTRADNKKISNFSTDKAYYEGSYLNVVINEFINAGLVHKKVSENSSYILLQA